MSDDIDDEFDDYLRLCEGADTTLGVAICLHPHPENDDGHELVEVLEECIAVALVQPRKRFVGRSWDHAVHARAGKRVKQCIEDRERAKREDHQLQVACLVI